MRSFLPFSYIPLIRSSKPARYRAPMDIDHLMNNRDRPLRPDPVARLDKIRQLSNTIQAMENVLVQCDDMPEFVMLCAMIRPHLAAAQALQFRLVHFSGR